MITVALNDLSIRFICQQHNRDNLGPGYTIGDLPLRQLWPRSDSPPPRTDDPHPFDPLDGHFYVDNHIRRVRLQLEEMHPMRAQFYPRLGSVAVLTLLYELVTKTVDGITHKNWTLTTGTGYQTRDEESWLSDMVVGVVCGQCREVHELGKNTDGSCTLRVQVHQVRARPTPPATWAKPSPSYVERLRHGGPTSYVLQSDRVST